MSNVVEITFQDMSCSGSLGDLLARWMIDQDPVLEPRSIHQQLHQFRPPYKGRQQSPSLLTTLYTRYSALSRRFIRRVASVLSLTALNTDSNELVVLRWTQCSVGKS